LEVLINQEIVDEDRIEEDEVFGKDDFLQLQDMPQDQLAHIKMLSNLVTRNALKSRIEYKRLCICIRCFLNSTRRFTIKEFKKEPLITILCLVFLHRQGYLSKNNDSAVGVYFDGETRSSLATNL